MAEPIALRNPVLVVAVDPASGRITEFRSPKGENLMQLENPQFNRAKKTENSYVAHGGERISPTEMFIWRMVSPDPDIADKYLFLPDKVIDGAPWRVVASTSLSVTIESGRSDWLGLVVRRTITLDPQDPKLSIETVMERVSRSAIPVQVWSIAVVKSPEFCLLGIDPSWRDSPFAWTVLSRPGRMPADAVALSGGVVKFVIPDKPDHPKVGAMGSWIAGVYKNEIFLQIVDFDPNGCYPDNSSVQAYADVGFVEIETLSQNRFLHVGEKLTNKVLWQLINRPSDGDLAGFLEDQTRKTSPNTNRLKAPD